MRILFVTFFYKKVTKKIAQIKLAGPAPHTWLPLRPSSFAQRR